MPGKMTHPLVPGHLVYARHGHRRVLYCAYVTADFPFLLAILSSVGIANRHRSTTSAMLVTSVLKSTQRNETCRPRDLRLQSFNSQYSVCRCHTVFNWLEVVH